MTVAYEPLTGVPVPTSDDAPANFGASFSAYAEAAAEFQVPRFANAGERDDEWPDAPNGAKCWLSSPAGHFTRWPNPKGWRPDGMPAPGESTTTMKSAIANIDLEFIDPTGQQFGCGCVIDVPSWARIYGGGMQLAAFLQARIGGGPTDGEAGFNLAIEYTLNGGDTFHTSAHSIFRGRNICATCLMSTPDDPATIDVAGVTQVGCEVLVQSRPSGDGRLQRLANESKIIWIATFVPED